MRRSQLAPLTLLFAVSAAVGAAVPTVALTLLAHRSSWVADGHAEMFAVGSGLGLFAVVLDLAWGSGARWARPWSIGRQVPRHWGHVHGPWLASARYGLRMGFAPATILNSWTWWAGFVIVVLTGWQAAVIGSLVFVFARALTMSIASAGPRTGEAMAKRSATLDRTSGLVQRSGLVTVALACGVLLGSGLWGRR